MKKEIPVHTKEETNVHVGVQVNTHALGADLKERFTGFIDDSHRPKWQGG